jgi:hypothetical protein
MQMNQCAVTAVCAANHVGYKNRMELFKCGLNYKSHNLTAGVSEFINTHNFYVTDSKENMNERQFIIIKAVSSMFLLQIYTVLQRQKYARTNDFTLLLNGIQSTQHPPNKNIL